FENTHLEMIMGKKIMDKLGYRSAIIVSSPYHMRRLQLIAGKVFGNDYQVGFTATPFEKFGTLGCFRSWKAFENVGSEYLKIGWFLVYCWFV
ncbi:MAG: YdcF family protein, partial [Deltaproteobacteria bacterium]|nr:YdcF family protein [Candidatus Tharpella aukensis]